MKRKAIVSIAAGASQIALLERIQRAGFALIAVDRNPDAPGMAMADHALALSTHGAVDILAALAVLTDRFEIKAVITKSSGLPVVTCAEVARGLELPGLNPAFAAGTIDKALFAELASIEGVAVPRTIEISQDESSATLRDIQPPWVVKPAITRVGKLGVACVHEESELDEAIAFARANSADDRAVVQEFVEGIDLTVAALFRNGEVLPLALLDEHVAFTEAGEALGRGFRLPSCESGSALEAQLFGLTRRLLTQAGTGFGLIAFRAPEHGPPVAIEAHLDLAGDFVSDRLFGGTEDFHLIDAVLELSAGGSLPECVPTFAPIAVRFLYAEDVADPAAAKALGALPGVSDIRVDLAPSGRLHGGRVGYAIVHGADPDELERHLEAVDRLLADARDGAPAHA